MKSKYPHIAMLTYAKDFLRAASVIANSGQASKTRISLTYLYGHALELALKSMLAKRGVPEEELRKKIGHDLEKALKKVLAKADPDEIPCSNELRRIVTMLNPEYKGKHLEYHPGTRGMRLPGETMMKAVDDLIGKLDREYRANLMAERKAGL